MRNRDIMSPFKMVLQIFLKGKYHATHITLMDGLVRTRVFLVVTLNMKEKAEVRGRCIGAVGTLKPGVGHHVVRIGEFSLWF